MRRENRYINRRKRDIGGGLRLSESEGMGPNGENGDRK